MRTLAHTSMALCVWAAAAQAQIPATYPWHNRVQPVVSVAIDLDPATADFRYLYAVSNGAGAEQRLSELYLEVAVPPSGMAAPADWEPLMGEGTNVIAWGATGDVDQAWVPAHDGDMPSFVSEIAPESALTGFVLLSPCGPTGEVTYYARGYNHIAQAPADDTSDQPYQIPQWRDDAVRGSVLGPGDCNVVADWGNRRPGVDGFVGLVNFASGATLPAGPVAVQLRFARNGESVNPASLQVSLNGVDVTAAFRTNSRGDRVAVFSPGSSPLQSGRNVLLVSVDGVVPGTTRTATDADRFTFTVP
jgi:hypothetical protein